MQKTNKKIYVFVGQNATTGRPNPNTGRMSTYGKIYRVDNLSAGRQFADYMERSMYRSGTYSEGQTIIVVGGKKTMRQYCLGSTIRDFEQDLDYADTMSYDADNDRWI